MNDKTAVEPGEPEQPCNGLAEQQILNSIQDDQAQSDIILIQYPSHVGKTNEISKELRERLDVKPERTILNEERHLWEFNILAVIIRSLDYYHELKKQGIDENWFFEIELKAFFKTYEAKAQQKVLLTKKLFIEHCEARYIKRNIENPIIAQYEHFYDDLLAFDFQENELPLYIEKFKKYYLLNVLRNHALELKAEREKLEAEGITDSKEDAIRTARARNLVDKINQIQAVPDGEPIDFDELHVRSYLKQDSKNQAPCKPVIVNADELHINARAIRKALPEVCPNLYRTLDAFSILENSSIKNIKETYFDEFLSEHFTFYKEIRHTDKGEEAIPQKENIPSVKLSKTVFHNANLATDVRELMGVSEFPIVNIETGELHNANGYDSSSKYYINCKGEIPIPDIPNFAPLERLVCDFPFVSESDKTAFFALVLSMLVLPSFDRNIPMFYVNAVAPRTGKNLLVDIATIIVHGKQAMTSGDLTDDTELRKRMLGFALEAKQFTFFNELPDEKAIIRKTLNSYLTGGQTFEGRRLGTNDNEKYKWKTVIAACGNNAQFGQELSERMIRINLDADCENPGERKRFEIPDIVAHTFANRELLLGQFLAILKSYIQAGKPQQNVLAIGNFQAWANLVLGALAFHGYHYTKTRNSQTEETPILDAIHELHKAFKNQEFTTSDIAAAIVYNLDLREALKENSSSLIKEYNSSVELNRRAMGILLNKSNGKRTSYTNSRGNLVSLKLTICTKKRDNKTLFKVEEQEEQAIKPLEQNSVLSSDYTYPRLAS